VLPVAPQTVEPRPWQRHRAILGAFAISHPNEQTPTVDVSGLKAQPFVEPQAECIDRGERDAPYRMANCG
jgi:hypothetical protein